MDREKAALYKRRSSILKTCKTKSTDDEENTGEIANQRRVSFANKFAVKPFTQDGDANTIWDATYEEVQIHSDQSICPTSDSAHMSTEVFNCNELSPHWKQSMRSNPALNITCANMDEDIEIENEDIHFAPVIETFKKSKPKFGIYVEEHTSKLENPTFVKPEHNTFINPSLLKENIQRIVDFVPPLNEENMQLETNTMDLCGKEIVEKNSIDLDSPGTTMNFTIHPMKKRVSKKDEDENYVQQENVEEDNMEFTTVIPTKFLQQKLKDNAYRNSDSLKNDVMDLTTNSLPNKVKINADGDDMEFTTPIPANIVQEEIIGTPEEDDMEFTKSISPKLLEKLRLKNAELENYAMDNAMDLTRKLESNKDNVHCNYLSECDMELEQYQNSENGTKYPQIGITNNSTKGQKVSLRGNVSSNNVVNKSSENIIKHVETCGKVENATEIPQIARTHHVDEVTPKGRESSFFQIDGSFHINPASEVDDTQYLINYKSRISGESPLRAFTTEPDKKNCQIYEETRHLHHHQPNKVNILSVVEIPKVAPQICNVHQENKTLNPQKEFKKSSFNKSSTSEINVFKPSSKNNTRSSFYEPMELGSSYITNIDDSSEKLNLSYESTKEKCHVIDEIINIESVTSLELENATIETLDVVTRSKSKVVEAKYSTDSPRIASDLIKTVAEVRILPEIKCHETDKIIFTTESASSFEVDEAPIVACGIIRRSHYGLAEGLTISTHRSTQEILAKTIISTEEPCLETICQEAKPISDQSLEVIQVDDSDDEAIENLSKSKIVLYDSNDSSDNSCSKSSNIIESKACASDKPKYGLNLPDNCTPEQLYDILGWSAEDRPKPRVVTPRLTLEEMENRRVEQRVKNEAVERAHQLLAESCQKILDAVRWMNEEDALETEEDLARNQGRDLTVLSMEEWLRQQKKIPSTFWKIHELTKNKCSVSSRNDFVYFNLAMESESYMITSFQVQNLGESKSVPKLTQFTSKLIVDKTQESQIRGAIGAKYNLRTFLEFLQMKLEDVVKIEREFLKLFGKIMAEAHLKFDDNFNLKYELVGRSTWLIEINCSDLNNLSEKSITNMSTLDGSIQVPEREIKNIAKKCTRGMEFLPSFVEAVYEFRNVRERQHCKVLNELLNRIEIIKRKQ